MATILSSSSSSSHSIDLRSGYCPETKTFRNLCPLVLLLLKLYLSLLLHSFFFSNLLHHGATPPPPHLSIPLQDAVYLTLNFIVSPNLASSLRTTVGLCQNDVAFVIASNLISVSIVFSDAWWIGNKDENLEELRQEFPKDLNLDQHAEYDFKGGAGAPCDGRQGFRKSAIKCVQQESPQDELEDDLTLSQNNVKESMEVTPIQHSARTAGKMFKFADASSLDDFIGNDAVTFEEEDEDIGIVQKTGNFMDFEASIYLVKKANKDVKEKKDNVKVSKFLRNGKKIEEREAGAETMTLKKQPKSTRSVEVYQRKSKSNSQGALSSRKRKADSIPVSNLSDPGSSPRVEDDDIEEFSRTSQDMNANDEDWIA
ncbi:DNA-binding protein RHL1 [Forsythia ovata]|uniref:DNA-binding protein RHL1 n=1 Tax=Forsythia ovata TaxID=205694 RepID=A0ABD1X043_9LAMI